MGNAALALRSLAWCYLTFAQLDSASRDYNKAPCADIRDVHTESKEDEGIPHSCIWPTSVDSELKAETAETQPSCGVLTDRFGDVGCQVAELRARQEFSTETTLLSITVSNGVTDSIILELETITETETAGIVLEETEDEVLFEEGDDIVDEALETVVDDGLIEITSDGAIFLATSEPEIHASIVEEVISEAISILASTFATLTSPVTETVFDFTVTSTATYNADSNDDDDYGGDDNGNSTIIGSVVGGVVGGLVLIAGMVLLFLVFLRRRRKRATAAAKKKPAAELPTQPSAAQLNSQHGVSQLYGDSAKLLNIESPGKYAA